ncbi:unnamed protein product, partial [marine sediment metagenome]
MTGAVGGYDNILYTPEGVVRRQGLIIRWENVKASTRYPPTLQFMSQRIQVHSPSSPNVDEVSCSLHQLQR